MERMKEEELLREIERYFDCLLSDEEEKRLLEELLHTDSRHPAVEEFKAVIGFRTLGKYMERSGERSVRRSTPLRVMQTVAACIVAFTLGAGIIGMFRGETATDECVAYVNGRKVTNDEAVLLLMRENIEEIKTGLAMAQEEMIDDIDELLPLIDRMESEFAPEDI